MFGVVLLFGFGAECLQDRILVSLLFQVIFLDLSGFYVVWDLVF